MKNIKSTLLLLLFPLLLQAQKEITLTMEECLEMATTQSLDAFLAQNMYLAEYWNYKSFKASRLPSLQLSTTPINFYNGISQVWDSEEDKYSTSHTKSLNSEAEFSLQQQISATGGTLSVTTGSQFLRYYSEESTYNTFTSTPVSLQFSQNLNGYNALKWRAKIDPESFELAKRTFLQERESLSINAIQLFFDLVNSQIQLEISERNYTNAQELFKIGKGRFEVGTITQDALLSLELDVYNSQLSATKAEQALLRARIDLNIFLNIDKNTLINCITPENISDIEISVDEAINKAMLNNSKIVSLHIRDLQTERDLRKTRAENRFSSSINLSYGLNGDNETFTNSYQNLSEKQRINMSFDIPIIDWGEGKGAIAVAQSNREAELIQIEQEKIAFEQAVSVNILEFNIQKKQVTNSAKADTIAQKGYDISYEIFKLGKLDVIKLNQAKNDQVSARKAYISSLENYWTYWYKIRQQTLFDFEKNIPLTEDFDALIND